MNASADDVKVLTEKCKLLENEIMKLEMAANMQKMELMSAKTARDATITAKSDMAKHLVSIEKLHEENLKVANTLRADLVRQLAEKEKAHIIALKTLQENSKTALDDVTNRLCDEKSDRKQVEKELKATLEE